jgi:tRNA C32,U32 (ribose-2'-O)-methylase TrmJ
MNLGQAVAVCSYEVARARDRRVERARGARGERTATIDEIEAAVLDAFPPAAEPRVEARHRTARGRLRTLLLRARATVSEVSLLRGLHRAVGRRV